MKELISQALRFKNNQLLVLNQQKLPHVEEWLICHTPDDMVRMIQTLQVRGAPLIGVAAALALAQFVMHSQTKEVIQAAALQLKSARPTAVNLAHCIDRQMQAYLKNDDPESIIHMAESLFLEDALLCDKMAKLGSPFIAAGDSVLTHCNTGGLVTTGMGTALGVIIHAHQNHRNIHVFVDETRPLLQGARLTAWELSRASVPYTLICDNMAASLMRKRKVQSIFVGADRIAANGDFANKIGTYSLAVLANYHKIPFYVVAPYTTFDSRCPNGESIVIEERAPSEVRGYSDLSWAPENALVYNPAFDVTPNQLVTAYIFDHGVVESFSKEAVFS